jgi:hypothetical protein
MAHDDLDVCCRIISFRPTAASVKFTVLAERLSVSDSDPTVSWQRKTGRVATLE